MSILKDNNLTIDHGRISVIPSTLMLHVESHEPSIIIQESERKSELNQVVEEVPSSYVDSKIVSDGDLQQRLEKIVNEQPTSTKSSRKKSQPSNSKDPSPRKVIYQNIKQREQETEVHKIHADFLYKLREGNRNRKTSVSKVQTKPPSQVNSPRSTTFSRANRANSLEEVISEKDANQNLNKSYLSGTRNGLKKSKKKMPPCEL